ncbi:endonuclease [Staphylococcus phage vB_SepS_BE22]|nr:endonuclease [Staphylococcus phage vB_SepS_BE22]
MKLVNLDTKDKISYTNDGKHFVLQDEIEIDEDTILKNIIVKFVDPFSFATLIKHYSKEKVRLLNVDTPERRQKNYEEAKRFTIECVEGKDIYVQTYKSDNFSRFLANVYYETDNEVRCLNDDLKVRGLIKEGSQWNKFGEERDGIF